MLTHRIRIMRLIGFDIYIDASWLFLAALVIWSLSTGYFPARIGALNADALSQSTYLTMAVFGALGLFASIIFHELSHSVIARIFGLQIRGITLFLFGGVAELDREPPHPTAEFLTAIAGPIASFVLAASSYAIAGALTNLAAPLSAIMVFNYIALINFILAIFNLIPAFPLDGGRAFRAIVWGIKGDLMSATRTAAALGQIGGIFLITFGVISLISGAGVGSLWLALIGLFLSGAARSAVSQMEAQQLFAGQPTSKFMVHDPVTVPPDISLSDFIGNYVYRTFHDMYPVVEQEQLLGCMCVRTLETIPQGDWPKHQVADVMTPMSPENTIAPDTDVLDALKLMERTKQTRLMVAIDRRLVGILTLKDVMKFMSLRAGIGKD